MVVMEWINGKSAADKLPENFVAKVQDAVDGLWRT
jgi:hypothetical protein